MNEKQNSELSKAKKTIVTEQKKTTPPTSQSKLNTNNKTVNTSLPSSKSSVGATQKGANTSSANAKRVPPRKRVRPLQTVGETQRSHDETLDEALDEAFDEFIDSSDFSVSEEIPVDAPEDVQRTAKPTNLLQQIKMRRQATVEKKMNTMEVVRRRSGFSDDDIEMIFELGYENEFGRLVGYDNLRKLKHDHQNRMSRESSKRYRTAFGYCGQDSITPQNKNRSITKYMHDRKYLIWRTILTVLALLLVVLLDYPALIGGAYEAFDASMPLLFPLLSTLIMVAATCLSYKQFNAGIRNYFKLRPTPYSTLSVIVPFV